jgi:proteasomal ATPase-associated factor 1
VNGLIENASVQDGEVETADKIVFCALGDGTFEVFDLRTKTSVFQSEGENANAAALKSIVYSDSHRMMATGSVQGAVTVFDVRSLGQPLASFYRNTASIEDLVFCADVQRLVVGTEDGLPYIADFEPGSVSVRAELVGGDCDAVRAVKVDGKGCVWTASDDAIVRKYRCE